MAGRIKERLKKGMLSVVGSGIIAAGEYIALGRILPNLWEQVANGQLPLIEKVGLFGALGTGAFIAGAIGLSSLVLYNTIIGIIPEKFTQSLVEQNSNNGGPMGFFEGVTRDANDRFKRHFF